MLGLNAKVQATKHKQGPFRYDQTIYVGLIVISKKRESSNITHFYISLGYYRRPSSHVRAKIDKCRNATKEDDASSNTL